MLMPWQWLLLGVGAKCSKEREKRFICVTKTWLNFNSRLLCEIMPYNPDSSGLDSLVLPTLFSAVAVLAENLLNWGDAATWYSVDTYMKGTRVTKRWIFFNRNLLLKLGLVDCRYCNMLLFGNQYKWLKCYTKGGHAWKLVWMHFAIGSELQVECIFAKDSWLYDEHFLTVDTKE